MALATGAAALAGITAASAYLDAKLHIRKDVNTLINMKRGAWEVEAAKKQKRICLWYPFEEQVKRLAPTNTECIWTRTHSYTWSQVYDNACRYSSFYRGLGLQPDSLVAFYLTNSPQFMFAMLGSWGVGCAPAMINHHLAGEALLHCLKVSGSKVLLVDSDSECRKRIEDVRGEIEALGMRIEVLDSALQSKIAGLSAERPPDSLRADMAPEFPMCLLYTSGSTGHPKACPFQMQRGFDLGSARIRQLGLRTGPDGDRWYDCMPLYHGTGCTVAIGCMIGGMALCIGPKFSTSQFWNDIRASRATGFVYVGETARYLLNAPPSPQDRDHRVRFMFGNGMRPDVWLRFQERFGIDTVAEFFNSTEGMFALLNVSRGPFHATAVGHHGALMRFLLRNTLVPVEIDPETEAIARDAQTGWAVPRKAYDEGGEMIVRVPSEEAFPGYWKNPVATAKKFERDLFEKGDVYYRTGDALRRSPDGMWYFMDRLGDTFRWKSENVSTQEVAEAIGHYPGIVEAMVYGVSVPGNDGKAGCAAIYIDPAKRDTFNYAALHAYLVSKLPKYAVPVFLRVMADLNPMHNQKPNKVPYKKAGISLAKIEADKKKGGKADTMLWCPAALGAAGKDGQPYVKFTEEDEQRLNRVAARL